jgi:hypothetical protein
MKTIELNPNQIITLNDYPVHSDSVLSKYFKECALGEKMALVPVIQKDVVRKHFDNELSKELEEFEKINPEATYFMLDGSHRTTALTLAGCKINSVIYEKDEDILEAKKLVATGDILKNGTLDYTIEENCEILNKLFNEKPYFMTVEQKTKKMIEENILPDDTTNIL